MISTSIEELRKLTKRYFEIALSHVNESAELSEGLRKAIGSIKLKAAEAEVPGYEDKPMKFGKFENREFVAMMTDIRKSTDIINGHNGLVNMFLIFYVYAGIVAKIVDNCGGTSTEFLGDGVLNLFDTKEVGLSGALAKSMEASWDIMDAKDYVLNPFFQQNGLPTINLGIGIDHGITIVTKFGFRNDTDLKAFGKCAYNASKLSKGVNEIIISPESSNVWPSTTGGNLIIGNMIAMEGKYGHQTARNIY